MVRHVLKAVRVSAGNWILWNYTTDDLIGEERAIQFATRQEAYDFCERSWPANSVWEGRRVHGGYSIKID